MQLQHTVDNVHVILNVLCNVMALIATLYQVHNRILCDLVNFELLIQEVFP